MTYDVAHKTFIVVGLARSGCAAGALLRRHGARVLGFDDADEAAVGRRWDREGLTDLAPQAFDALHTGGLWPDLTPDAVIVSPGVPLDHVRLVRLPADVPVLGEMELGARFCRSPQVAVTGTNGKSTTTELIAHLLRAAGRGAEALGNLGRPFCEVADTMPAETVAVLEVSSFQLESVSTFAPVAGLVLNLAPDHLDRYPDLAAYFAAKRRLAEIVPPEGAFITATDCNEARSWDTRARCVLFGIEDDGAHVFYRDGVLHTAIDRTDESVLDRSELALQSPPNLANALAAVAVGAVLGLPAADMAAGLRDFRGLAHRHEIVGRRGPVVFVNDSKATNVHAVCAGLQGYPDEVVLIVGGSGKGEDYRPLREVMGAVKHVVTLGAEGPAIGAVLADLVPVTAAADMDEAVAVATDLAAGLQAPAAVLLSPACASFDMYANYRARGQAFAEAARQAGAKKVG